MFNSGGHLPPGTWGVVSWVGWEVFAVLPNPFATWLSICMCLLSLSVEVSSTVQIFHRLQGEEKKPTILLMCSSQMARGGKPRASAKHLEDVFAVTCSTSFLKAQLQNGGEAAVNTSCMLPSLMLPLSAVLPSAHPSRVC